MATLTGNTIASTYTGLLSVTGAVGADTVEVVTDGAGTSTSLSLSQQRATITLGSGAADDFIVDGTTFVVEGDNNRVGIGTATPFVSHAGVASTMKLHLNGGTAATSNIGDNPILLLENRAGAAGNRYGINFRMHAGQTFGMAEIGAITENTGSQESGGIYFATKQDTTGDSRPTEAMRIDDSGNVGIGTATPTAKLHIHDTAENGLKLTSSDSDWRIYPDEGADGLAFAETGTAVQMYIKAGGNVGIGTATPSAPLHISGNTNSNLEIEGATANLITIQALNDARNAYSTLKYYSSSHEFFAGNVVIGTAGKGIDFSAYATSGNPSSNLLDDYEEGTWIPIVTGATNGAAVNYGMQVGGYTKIGRLVHTSCHVVLTNANNSGGVAISGNVTVAGLPFTPSNVNQGYATGIVSYDAAALPTSTDNSATVAATVIAFINKNNTAVSIKNCDGAASPSNLQVSELSADGGLIFTITYFV